jgi:hypothetical protein
MFQPGYEDSRLVVVHSVDLFHPNGGEPEKATKSDRQYRHFRGHLIFYTVLSRKGFNPFLQVNKKLHLNI